MPKAVADAVLDAALNKIKTAVRQTVTVTQPATFAGISGATVLASATMASGDYTLADDATLNGGRKVTMAAKTAVAVTATGSANFVNLDDGTTLLYVTTCPAVTLTNGGTVNIPTWRIAISDPI